MITFRLIPLRKFTNFVLCENVHHMQQITFKKIQYTFLLQVKNQHTGRAAKIEEIKCKIDDKSRNKLMPDIKCRKLPNCHVNMDPKELITVVTQKDATSNTSTLSTSSSVTAKLNWIYSFLKSPTLLWYFACQITIFAVGIFSKFIMVFMNKTTVYNKERLVAAVAKRPKGVPLVTVSNHYSCFDDPGLWGVLPLRYICNSYKIRWSMAAHDICFANIFHSIFFMFGKCIPVVRGLGVYQEAVDLCIQKCALGQWVHVFPEGKVNLTKEEIRIKWGVGRIIYESPRVPIVLPMWHFGMDDLMPNVDPYRFKWRQKVTFNIGEPLDLNNFIQDLKDREVPEPEARKLIADKIQAVFHDLRQETKLLHEKEK